MIHNPPNTRKCAFENNPEPTVTSASFGRRLGSLVYDAIAVIAIVFFACFIPVLFSGEAIKAGNLFFLAYILGVIFSYFAICWQKGKTPGMQVWKLEIKRFNGAPVKVIDSLIRFTCAGASMAIGGIGYLSALWRSDRLSWPDRASKTYIRKC
jgi:uncharacterized RDD family membrane protein YckC